MTSILRSVSRLLKAMATSGVPPSKTGSPYVESPNVFIFPPHLVDKTNVEGLPKPYIPGELLGSIMENANAVDYIGNIFVVEIRYYKESAGAQHEYLVVRVEDASHRYVNYLKTDRCPRPGEVLNQPPKMMDSGDSAPAAIQNTVYVLLAAA